MTFIGCENIPEGYKIYRTFDEYTLKGVGQSVDKLKKPFIAAKFGKDKISVLVFDKNGDVRQFEYNDNGDYWHTLYKIQLKYDPKNVCDTTPLVIEKFIFDDTIMVYQYYYDSNKSNKKKGDEFLYLITKRNCVWLSDTSQLIIDSADMYKSLKKNFVDYQNSYARWDFRVGYQPRTYVLYNKEYRGDTMFIYERDEKRNKTLSTDYRIFDNLGEYGIMTGWSLQ